jgi:hypothetical protein
MCGSCRRFFQRAARKRGERIEVADGSFLRVFQPDGSVDIYFRDIELPILRVEPLVEPSVSATGRFEEISW